MLHGKILVFYAAFVLLRNDLLTSILKRVMRYFELTKMNRLWLTQIFLYRFHISCKSELRRTDRRAAKCVENIFFKTKKLQMKILLGKSQIALRKHKTGSNSITAGQLKKEGALEKLMHAVEGYRLLRSIRGSPPYFEKAKKDLFGMIRQLGPATLLCSFSAAETKWIHLLKMLGKLVDTIDYTNEQLENMTWEEKCRLIQSDPVTCACQFDYQV